MFIDCTLRDGGYYNGWHFDLDLVRRYLDAMSVSGVQLVELGLRSVQTAGSKGAFAFSTDDFLNTLNIPEGLKVGVMVNASELVASNAMSEVLERLFPNPADASPVDLIRIACHVHEFEEVLEASSWLKEKGYDVGFNLMQVSDRSQGEIEALAAAASRYPIDVLYFADSMGSMNPEDTKRIVSWLRNRWSGDLGIHTHDNLGLALTNTLCAMREGVTWVDSTVTGMGRGPGNARTEELAIELREKTSESGSLVPLMQLVTHDFSPMQKQYGWGTNPYYYLTGKYGIHPTYVQEMLQDARYNEEDIFAVIEHLRIEGGKKYSPHTLDAARHFYRGEPTGKWEPKNAMKGREVLLLGTGPGVLKHQWALEQYIEKQKPLVMALNTQDSVRADLIDVRVACHPVRLLADCKAHTRLPQPLITPYSMLPDDVSSALSQKEILDFGICVEPDRFSFSSDHCILPTSLVAAYALAIAASGQASRVLMAGFDGYGADDSRSAEMRNILDLYQSTPGARDLIAITPSRYGLRAESVYGIAK